LPWQLEQINLHPDMKLTSHGRFINGGFVASMEIHADLAIATLKRAIQFSDTISPVCLPSDESVATGSFSGWNADNKSVESSNVTIEKIEGDVFRVLRVARNVKFIEGEMMIRTTSSIFVLKYFFA
jgi:hypothetical protein